jgi:hypothetical protein
MKHRQNMLSLGFVLAILVSLTCASFNAFAADPSSLLDQIIQRGHILVGTNWLVYASRCKGHGRNCVCPSLLLGSGFHHTTCSRNCAGVLGLLHFSRL